MLGKSGQIRPHEVGIATGTNVTIPATPPTFAVLGHYLSGSEVGPDLALVVALQRIGLEMHVAAGHRLWTLNTPRVASRHVDDAKRPQASPG